MLGLLVLILIVITSFAAGYGTRSAMARRRRTNYLKWEPYIRPSRASRPPEFLLRSNQNVTPIQRFASGSRRNG
jgi:hypothetical protein